MPTRLSTWYDQSLERQAGWTDIVSAIGALVCAAMAVLGFYLQWWPRAIRKAKSLDMYPRIIRWLTQSVESIKSLYLVWIGLFLYKTVEHRFYGWVNERLDAYTGTMAGIPQTVFHYCSDNPSLVSLWIFLAVLLSLFVHAYFDTKNTKTSADEEINGTPYEQLPKAHLAANDVKAPRLSITAGASLGGMILFPDFNWYYVGIFVTNTDHAMSACDLVVKVEWELENGKVKRNVDRAFFVDRESGNTVSFPNKIFCLQPQLYCEAVIAVFSEVDRVMTLNRLGRDAFSPHDVPIGEELYPEVWWCRVTAEAQNIIVSERFRFKVQQHGLNRFMLPPDTPGEKG
jgi:hypothetical protein